MKKYQASTLEAALAAIRAELGPNAVIVHQSEVRKGPLGLLGRPQVEVVAAVDERPAARPAPPLRRPAAERPRVEARPAPRAAQPLAQPRPARPTAAAAREPGGQGGQ